MNSRRLILFVPLICTALALVACGNFASTGTVEPEAATVVPEAATVVPEATTAIPEATATPVASHGGPVDDYVSLVDSLGAAGATVEPAETVEQAIFEPVVGQIIKVNGQDVQVFEFESEESAQTAAETISPDGSSTSTTMITWIATPHFYRAGKIIVLYVGDDSEVLSLLGEVLGDQFAGG